MSRAKPLWDRFWPKVDADGDCWVWIGSQIKGYGAVWAGEERRAARAHRVVWELLIGPIGEGLTIDHRCLNKLCVNPTHLELVTPAENSRRARGGAWHLKSMWTHCARGHEYTPESTATQHGRRICRICRNRVARERYQPRPAAPRPLRAQCKRGHPLTDDNVMVWRNVRRCRTCRTAQERTRRRVVAA